MTTSFKSVFERKSIKDAETASSTASETAIVLVETHK